MFYDLIIEVYVFLASIGLILFVIGISFLAVGEISDKYSKGAKMKYPVATIGILILAISLILQFNVDLMSSEQAGFYLEQTSRIGIWFGAVITATGFVIWITET